MLTRVPHECSQVVEVLQQLPLSSFGKKDYYEQEKSLGSTPETCTADFRNGPTCTDVGRNGTVSDKAFRNNILTQKDECQDRCPESTSTVGASGGLGNLSKVFNFIFPSASDDGSSRSLCCCSQKVAILTQFVVVREPGLCAVTVRRSIVGMLQMEVISGYVENHISGTRRRLLRGSHLEN